MKYEDYKEISDLVEDKLHDGMSWLNLEQSCNLCFGKGKVKKEVCKRCEGKGYVVTNLGIHILDFVRRNLETA